MADRYRFAFDLGTNSIGWSVFQLNKANHPIDLVDAGVRIFSDGRDPKSGASLAENRRGPRAMRRRRDRYIQRRTFLMDELVKSGLMPVSEADRKALEHLDPYRLRRQGLDEKLDLHALGRALFHLNQRRGFQSNRIADTGDDDDGGKIKDAEKRLKAQLKAEGCRTYGEFLARRQDHAEVRLRQAVRVRMRGQGTNALYDFYPTRDLLKHEFDALWSVQAKFHSELTPALRDRLFNAMFFQRPLKPPVIGKCTFYPEETRLSKAPPLSQARRIYQDVNHLKYRRGLAPWQSLTLNERDRLVLFLMAGESLTFAKIRKELKLPADTVFSIEEGAKIDKLVGNQIAERLGYKKGPLRERWGDFTPAQREDIVEQLISEPDEDKLFGYLRDAYGLSDDVARLTMKVRLPDGHDNLGLTATTKVLEELKRSVVTYDKAVKAAKPDKHHSDERDGVILDHLPYYGEVLERHTVGGSSDPNDDVEKRYGRLTNPTVHVAMNQLRRVVNALIERYGHPEQIVLELARDLKLSQKQKDDLERENRRNRDKNEARRKLLEEEGYVANPGNLILLRLWEELGPPMQRHCVYTGQPISLHQLLSGDVEIEHILPYSRTLDDTFANKTLAFLSANRGKRNQAPCEAFSGDQYDAIRQRARNLPPNKRWRFEPDAMERFENEDRDFLARQLNETRHLAKLARKYLVGINNDPNDVWVVTGQLTALMRARFGLNSILSDHNHKNRTDHRHHAIDACVIGICDRALLQSVARAAGRRESNDELNEITKHFEPPFPTFRDRVDEVVHAIIVSHKPDHGSISKDSRKTSGALHNDTNYGINETADRIDGELVTRKAIDALTANDIDKVRDLHLRSQLQMLRAEVGKDAKALAKALAEFGDTNDIRRVRILKKQEDYIAIRDRKTGEPYRAVIPGENHAMDIIEDSAGIWRGYATTVFDFNSKESRPGWRAEFPSARLIMRVHKGDMVEVTDDDGVRRVKRVVRLSPSNNILYLVNHNEGGEFPKRHEDKDDPFRWDFANVGKLRDRMCRPFNGNELGKI
jgi:CRISPR-associated endonuclease Csn1